MGKSLNVTRASRRLARYLMALAIAALSGSASAQGDYLGTVFTGLWSAVGEEGSGVTATHEEPVIFLTFFLYRGDRAPYWVTATVTRGPDSGDSYVYTGDLYETNGPGFAGPFNSASVTYRKVGTVTFSSTDLLNALLTYSIDGVVNTKALRRYTLSNLVFSGSYAGSIAYQMQGCTAPQLNGRSFVDQGLTTITQPSGSLKFVLQGSKATCTFTGAYSQFGSWGAANGTLSCTDGLAGHFIIFAMQQTIVGFTAALVGSSQDCRDILGEIGGIGVTVSP